MNERDELTAAMKAAHEAVEHMETWRRFDHPLITGDMGGRATACETALWDAIACIQQLCNIFDNAHGAEGHDAD